MYFTDSGDPMDPLKTDCYKGGKERSSPDYSGISNCSDDLFANHSSHNMNSSGEGMQYTKMPNFKVSDSFSGSDDYARESDNSMKNFSTPFIHSNKPRVSFNINTSVIAHSNRSIITSVADSDGSDMSILEDSVDDSNTFKTPGQTGAIYSAKKIFVRSLLNNATCTSFKSESLNIMCNENDEDTKVKHKTEISNPNENETSLSTNGLEEDTKKLSLISNKINIINPDEGTNKNNRYNLRGSQRVGKENAQNSKNQEFSTFLPKILGTPCPNRNNSTEQLNLKRPAGLFSPFEIDTPLARGLKSKKKKKKVENISFGDNDFSKIMDSIMTLKMSSDEESVYGHVLSTQTKKKAVFTENVNDDNTCNSDLFTPRRRLFFRNQKNNSLDDDFEKEQENSLASNVNFTPHIKSRLRGLGALLNNVVQCKSEKNSEYEDELVFNKKSSASSYKNESFGSKEGNEESKCSPLPQKITEREIDDIASTQEQNSPFNEKINIEYVDISQNESEISKHKINDQPSNNNSLHLSQNNIIETDIHETSYLNHSRNSENSFSFVHRRSKKTKRLYFSESSDEEFNEISDNSQQEIGNDNNLSKTEYGNFNESGISKHEQSDVSNDVMDISNTEVDHNASVIENNSNSSLDSGLVASIDSLLNDIDNNVTHSKTNSFIENAVISDEELQPVEERSTKRVSSFQDSSVQNLNGEDSVDIGNHSSTVNNLITKNIYTSESPKENNEQCIDVDEVISSGDRTKEHNFLTPTANTSVIILSDDDDDSFSNILKSKTPKKITYLNCSEEEEVPDEIKFEDWKKPSQVPRRRTASDKYCPELLIHGDHDSSSSSDVEIKEYGLNEMVELSSESSEDEDKDKAPWSDLAAYLRKGTCADSLDNSFATGKKRKVTDMSLPGHSSSPEHTSFLLSLSPHVPPSMCHPDAKKYIDSFTKHKDTLIDLLFKLYNQEIFDNGLPLLEIKWSGRLTTTSGITKSTSKITPTGKIRTSGIKLSKTIVDSCWKLRDVLLHEMCHAANWLIDERSDGHGPLFRKWADKAWFRFPEIPKVRTCHRYELKWKYIYKCTSCGYETAFRIKGPIFRAKNFCKKFQPTREQAPIFELHKLALRPENGIIDSETSYKKSLMQELLRKLSKFPHLIKK